jgi:hypothetical protein
LHSGCEIALIDTGVARFRELERLVDLFSIDTVLKHDDLEAHTAELNCVAYLDSVALNKQNEKEKGYYSIDEVASLAVCVFDYLPSLGGWELSFFLVVFNCALVI